MQIFTPVPFTSGPLGALKRDFLSFAEQHTLLWTLITLPFYLAWWAVTHPFLSTPAVYYVWLWVKLGGWEVAAYAWALTGVILAVIYLGVMSWLSDTTPGVIVVGTWRGQWLKRSWPRICRKAGITHADGEYPALGRVRITPSGNLEQTLRPGKAGISARKVMRAKEDLEAVTDRQVFIRKGKSWHHAVIEYVWGDPLSRTIRLADLVRVAKGRLCFGLTASGQPVSIAMLAHLLLIGVSRAGKSSLLWALIAQLVFKGVPFRLWVLDNKGGMELRKLRKIAHAYAVTQGETVALLERMVDALEAQQQRLGDLDLRSSTPTDDNPLNIVIADELLALTLLMPAARAKVVDACIQKLLSQGAAATFYLWGCTQSAKANDLSNYRQFIEQRVVLKTDDEHMTVAAMGSRSKADQAPAHEISRDTRGVGYLEIEGEEIVRFRSAYVTDREIRSIVRRETPESMAHLAGEASESLEDRPTALYRWFRPFDSGQCLQDPPAPPDVRCGCRGLAYVGIAVDPGRRAVEHFRRSPWFGEVDGTEPEIEWHPNRQEALDAETEACELEHPIHNRAKNPSRLWGWRVA